jgi:hypothetical protein
LRLEKYVATYLSAGGIEEEALDSMVTHHIINTMIPCIVNSGAKNEKFAVIHPAGAVGKRLNSK